WKSKTNEPTRSVILPASSVLSAWLALLAKEQGVTVLIVCLCYHLQLVCARQRERSGKEIANLKWPGLDKYTLTIVSMLSILVGFRVWILNGSLPQFSEQDNPAAFSQSLLS
ncbi:uncharacterized protein LOC111083353, partial [Limulus polyphemus]|uniref:Uncharacterized protein LOC111083353 n=1 Tax=Limulus polyphemus TaxID=6850 RepID=A0ABM1RVZ2_LIMPO